jgi:hypothetical protein
MYRTVFKLMLLCVLAAAALLSIRFFLVEPDEMAMECLSNDTDYLCRLRTATISGFSRHLFGEISLAAAVLAAVGALRYFALIALISGLAGMILYDFQLAALGFLLGMLIFARVDVKMREERQRQQQAPHTPV